MKHTQEPWRTGPTPFYLKAGQTGSPITIRSPHHTEEIATVWTCALPTEANAKRIVDCVNALKGIENPNNFIKELLEAYSKFLEEHGYMDTDWWQEEPYAIDTFLKELNKKTVRQNPKS